MSVWSGGLPRAARPFASHQRVGRHMVTTLNSPQGNDSYVAEECLDGTASSDATDKSVPESPTLAAARQKSVELLYDYTKFHIGVYLTLTGSYLTAAFANFSGKRVLLLNLVFIAPAVIFTMIAGLAGGVIVSSLTQWIGGSSLDFLRSSIGPWDWKCLHFEARKWTYVEHTAFWLGLICAVLSFVPVCVWSEVSNHVFSFSTP